MNQYDNIFTINMENKTAECKYCEKNVKFNLNVDGSIKYYCLQKHVNTNKHIKNMPGGNTEIEKVPERSQEIEQLLEQIEQLECNNKKLSNMLAEGFNDEEMIRMEQKIKELEFTNKMLCNQISEGAQRESNYRYKIDELETENILYKRSSKLVEETTQVSSLNEITNNSDMNEYIDNLLKEDDYDNHYTFYKVDIIESIANMNNKYIDEDEIKFIDDGVNALLISISTPFLAKVSTTESIQYQLINIKETEELKFDVTEITVKEYINGLYGCIFCNSLSWKKDYKCYEKHLNECHGDKGIFIVKFIQLKKTVVNVSNINNHKCTYCDKNTFKDCRHYENHLNKNHNDNKEEYKYVVILKKNMFEGLDD